VTLAASGQEVTVFQVLDPQELTLELGEAAQFEDLESGQRVYLDPALARGDYQAKLEAHCAAVRSACRHHGIGYHRVSTADPVELSLWSFVQERRHA